MLLKERGVVYEGVSTVLYDNHYWDCKTGEALLTKPMTLEGFNFEIANTRSLS